MTVTGAVLVAVAEPASPAGVPASVPVAAGPVAAGPALPATPADGAAAPPAGRGLGVVTGAGTAEEWAAGAWATATAPRAGAGVTTGRVAGAEAGDALGSAAAVAAVAARGEPGLAC
ncbi:MAG TPA: hypothetical protein VFN87_05240, partial [Solirubrobacteraceae bacterium]|nr:hypothetical protein [Solirubrobacteraceae bacterium]